MKAKCRKTRTSSHGSNDSRSGVQVSDLFGISEQNGIFGLDIQEVYRKFVVRARSELRRFSLQSSASMSCCLGSTIWYDVTLVMSYVLGSYWVEVDMPRFRLSDSFLYELMTKHLSPHRGCGLSGR